MPFNVLSKESVEGILKKVPLAPGYGYALFPNEWVVLNEEEASASKYVYVFEAMNGDKYGVPHFIYFSDICYWDVPARDAECNKLDNLIRAYSEECDDAFKHQVIPAYALNEDGSSEWINADAWKESFVPGHFNLPIKGSKLPFCEGWLFPFGAHIVRPEDYDFEQDNRIFQTLVSSSCDSSGQSPIDD